MLWISVDISCFSVFNNLSIFHNEHMVADPVNHSKIVGNKDYGDPMLFMKILKKIQYLGLNGLLQNILGIMTLLEGGFATSVVYNLYKPLAEKNTR